MPILDTAANELNARLDTATTTDAQSFSPGKTIDAAFVYPKDSVRRQTLQQFIDTIPAGIHEGLRAALYAALTSSPRTRVNFRWQPAYDWELSVTQTPSTMMTAGVMNVTLRSRYLGDAHPLHADMVQYQQSLMLARKPAQRGARRTQRSGKLGSKSRGKGAASPAKNKPSTSS